MITLRNWVFGTELWLDTLNSGTVQAGSNINWARLNIVELQLWTHAVEVHASAVQNQTTQYSSQKPNYYTQKQPKTKPHIRAAQNQTTH